MKKPQRYSQISPRLNTAAEVERIDALARAADVEWERQRAAHGRMTDEEAARIVQAERWYAKRTHSCGRTKTGRAVRIRAACELYTKVGTYTIPGLGSGLSLADGVHAATWEEAIRLARLRVKVRELNARAEVAEAERARERDRRKWNRRHGPKGGRS